MRIDFCEEILRNLDGAGAGAAAAVGIRGGQCALRSLHQSADGGSAGELAYLNVFPLEQPLEQQTVDLC